MLPSSRFRFTMARVAVLRGFHCRADQVANGGLIARRGVSGFAYGT